MSRFCPSRLHTLALAASLLGCGAPPGGNGADSDRESIFDRVVRLEPRLHTEIPAVGRWCDEIDALRGRRVDTGEIALHVEEEGSGRPIVLLHGGPGGSHHYFHPWFSRAAEFARVIYYDQRGCGLSDWTPGPDGYSVEQAVEDLDRLRAALGIERWVVLGYSYGGFLAQLYTLHYPHRVDGLVLSSASPGLWTDLGPSRQGEFISDAERAHMRALQAELDSMRVADGLDDSGHFELLVYNNLLNGDWKRQSLYRPSREEIARKALYDADFAPGFNGVMRRTVAAIDLTGAFEANPIPTLILSGEHDLNYGEEKHAALRANHPRARSEHLEAAGHGIFSERPDAYFDVLREFVEELDPVPAPELEAFRAEVASWDEARRGSPLFIVRSSGPGRGGSDSIAAAFRPGWLSRFDDLEDLMRLGFALYDAGRYEHALAAFQGMEAQTGPESRTGRPIALIWQGHMLDLLGRRSDAVARYRDVADMRLTGQWTHREYGWTYEFDAHARARIEEPFTRRENVLPD